MLKKLTRLAVILGGFAVLLGCASGLAGPEYRNMVDNRSLYVVGWPPTGREFRLYNKPRPPYIGFMFVTGSGIGSA
jgi:hypothetical protein